MRMIEIRGVNFRNAGSAMMVDTVMQELGGRGGEDRFCVALHPRGCRYSDIAPRGMYPLLSLRRKGIDLSFLERMIPHSLAKSLELAFDEDIDGLIDISGFAYGDAWPSRNAKFTAKKALAIHGKSGKIALLPQAFGPFSRNEERRYVAQLVELADLVWARDSVSMEAIFSISKDFKSKVRMAGDFTVLLKPADANPLTIGKYVAIVPNVKMYKVDRPGYLGLLVATARAARTQGYEVVIVTHEDSDLDVIRDAGMADGRAIAPPILFRSENVKVIKKVLSDAEFVFSSRYHATISALTSFVPVIGTSWSHKYEELYKEFSFSRFLLPDMAEAACVKLVGELSSKEGNESARATLTPAIVKMRREAEALFSELREIFGFVPGIAG